MKSHPLALREVLLLEPRVFGDQRGHFFESYNARTFAAVTGLDIGFVQDNQSRSARGVLRGLHYQLPPGEQGKLVRAISGSIFDVAVDIRRSSPTFGKWVGEVLSSENQRQLWIPAGFAHGFVALTEGAEVFYKTTGFYAKDLERSIRWNDPQMGIEWPADIEVTLVERDANAPILADAQVFD